MNEEEWKVLDARVMDVLSSRAFRAVLANGHSFTAFVAAPDAGREPAPGDIVRVEMSSSDMSKGRIVVGVGMRMST